MPTEVAALDPSELRVYCLGLRRSHGWKSELNMRQTSANLSAHSVLRVPCTLDKIQWWFCRWVWLSIEIIAHACFLP